MADSRSGAGGKIVANRRKQRLATTPYDRPQPSPSQPPPGTSPSWFSGRILPSARAIASGAGRILANVLYSESSSSSEEDEDEGSGADGLDNDDEIPDDGGSALHERIERKRIIEQLIMQETFSREECDRLTELLTSRVMDWPTETERRLAASPWKMTDNEVGDIYNKAVLEAKKWFQEKKMGPSSEANAYEGTHALDPSLQRTEYVHSATGSPIYVARSYMRDRPPWASPTKQIELNTPLIARMELIKEGASVGHDSLSSTKKRNSVASGSWNIQEELRRVRAKASEDMLRTPSSRIDPSSFATAMSRQEGRAKKSTDPDSPRKMHSIGVLMDAGVSSDPALAALESRQDDKASEALSSKPASLSSWNNEDSKVGQIDGGSFALKLMHHTSSKSEELHSEPHGPPANEVTEIIRRQGVNGFSSSQISLLAGGVTRQNREPDNEGNHNTDQDNSVNASNLEGKCELLTEACVEVPIVTETASIVSGSQNSLSMLREDLSEEIIQPPTDGKTDVVHGRQQAKKSGENLRRSKRRSKR